MNNQFSGPSAWDDGMIAGIEVKASAFPAAGGPLAKQFDVLTKPGKLPHRRLESRAHRRCGRARCATMQEPQLFHESLPQLGPARL